MEKKTVKFQNLAELGSGYAVVDDESISIVTEGINGSLKAWLTGGEAVQIGNLVGGKLKRNISTQKHNGILITQSGRQMLYAQYREAAEPTEENITQARENTQENKSETEKIEYGEFQWKKITGIKYPCENNAVKYILSNRSIYDNFLKTGYYWYGEKDGCLALGFPAEEKENPLFFLGVSPVYSGGCYIICINKEENALYTE